MASASHENWPDLMRTGTYGVLEPIAEAEHDRGSCPMRLIRLLVPGSGVSRWPGCGP